MAEFVGALLVGAICIVLGISNMRGNITSLHAYHRHRVSEKDRPAFAKTVGLGTILCGCALLVFGGCSAIAFHTEQQALILVGTALLIPGLIAGLGMSIYAMIKYNKGIF